jgi:hypothetical protein
MLLICPDNFMPDKNFSLIFRLDERLLILIHDQKDYRLFVFRIIVAPPG